MFLDLPIPCQHLIYEKLPIQDRVKLNLALPKTQRIGRTLRTSPWLDKRLALASRIVKHKQKHDKKIPPACLDFLEKHKHDATVKELVAQYHLNINYNSLTSPEDTGTNDMFTIQHFVHSLKNKTLTRLDLDKLWDTTMNPQSKMACDDIQYYTYKCASLEQLNLLLSHPKFATYIHVKNIVFDAFNHSNEELIMHIMTSQGSCFNVPRESFDRQIKNVKLLIGTSAHRDVRAMVYKHVPFSEKDKHNILDIFMERFDVDGIEQFNSIFGSNI